MAVNTAGLAFVDTVERWLRSGVSGAIEWQDGKRRRLVFLDGDTVTLVQSNLRSESVERLSEQDAGVDPIAATRQMRLRALLCEKDGSIVVHPGSEPPNREPVPAALALWEVADALPFLAPDSFPAAAPAALPRLAALPWSPDLLSYVAALDGTRSTEDVLDFGPEAGPVLASALALARVLGAIDLGQGPTPRLQVKPQGGSGQRPSGLFAQREAETSLFQASDDEVTEDLEARLTAATNHFEVLGVVWQDSPETVRKAYVALAAQLHPDRWAMSPPEAQANMGRLFDVVRGAWETLGDPKTREAYTRKVIFGELTEEEKANLQLQAILDAERFLTLGQREVSAQRFPQAYELLKQALASDPLHPQVRAYTAYVVVRLNPAKTTPQVEAAIREVETIAQEIPGADWARVLLGRVRLARGDNAGAQRAFIEALKINPSNQDATTEMWKLKGQRAEKEEPAPGFFARIFKR